MDAEYSDYQSFLLRMWRQEGSQAGAWRASLESPHTGERWHFAGLAELFDFLGVQTADQPLHKAQDKRERR